MRSTTDLGPPELALESVVVERGDVRLHMVRSTVSDPHERRAPVLFLHGFPDSHATWSRQLEGLASMHPVAAFDQRGVGDFSAPRDPDGYQLARHLDDIDAVIDELVGPEGKVHLVGHDWGAMLGVVLRGRPAGRAACAASRRSRGRTWWRCARCCATACCATASPTWRCSPISCGAPGTSSSSRSLASRSCTSPATRSACGSGSTAPAACVATTPSCRRSTSAWLAAP